MDGIRDDVELLSGLSDPSTHGLLLFVPHASGPWILTVTSLSVVLMDIEIQ